MADSVVSGEHDVETITPNLAQVTLSEVLARPDSALTRAVRRLQHLVPIADVDEEGDLSIAGFNNWVG